MAIKDPRHGVADAWAASHLQLMNTPLHIAFCADRNYVMPTGVAMVSVCEQHRDVPLCFHVVLTGDAPSQELCQIAKQYGVGLEIYRPEPGRLPAVSCSGAPHVTTTCCARFLLPELLPATVSRLIYLDSDVCVVDSLVAMWQLPMAADQPVLAAPAAYGCSWHKVRRYTRTPMAVTYHNSGVLLMNLDCWRRERLADTLLHEVVSHPLPLLDEMALHTVLGERIQPLPLRYNMAINFFFERDHSADYRTIEEWEASLDHAVVWHYCMCDKPWNCRDVKRAECWLRCYRLSPWRDRPLHLKRNTRREYHLDCLDMLFWSEATLVSYSLPVYLAFVKVYHRIRRCLSRG